ncbi:glucose-6-phosphate dehydrogenase [Actinomyces sp. zg-332]|uniref:glucose-6-phosphate dehydrogenase n=1 Tax=Actinomyces sp. zg-332 TaxID=2708340 RepID=UPI001422AD83|nr:glucose-6-phosphate dehydrogenase [Actinomyces sp. zg-332]QPK93967.1 glucose-6-phosphate dehydrogenase [Actinomyces sp. zg-332]
MTKIGITIFGGTGDLSYRKLLPALYNLFIREKLGEDFDVCAIGRRDYSIEEYISIIQPWIEKYARLKVEQSKLDEFYKHINYMKLDFTNLDDYEVLQTYYKKLEVKNHIVYMAVAPEFFNVISNGIAKIPAIRSPKIILEKPFGANLEDAKILNDKLEYVFGYENIYRIDHYLGKEMVRNILTIRESNPLFSNVWNKENIECVHISALELVGIGSRAGYYDSTGAVKDMVQNHLLQILSIVAMDDPSKNLSEQQFNVLRDLRDVNKIDIKDSLILAQYDGYLDEENVKPNSNTETYAALKLFIDNDRWRGVPFFIRTGKCTSDREMEVTITFKRISPDVEPNLLIVKIQPIEGVYLEFNIKTPGEEKGRTKAKMEFCQNCEDIFRINTPEAYERMLLACINNDNSWFSKWGQIELSWKYIDELMRGYTRPIYSYSKGSNGPIEADNLAENPDQKWRK